MGVRGRTHKRERKPRIYWRLRRRHMMRRYAALTSGSLAILVDIARLRADLRKPIDLDHIRNLAREAQAVASAVLRVYKERYDTKVRL